MHAATSAGTSQGLAKRVIACLDVRANDAGDLVVTKGDQYDVRDKGTAANDVRNLGLPVQLAGRYFVEGADEVTFLNITGFRDFPLGDLPMLEVSSFLSFHSLPYSLGCGAIMTHQTSWLESTGVCGVQQILAGGSSVFDQ